MKYSDEQCREAAKLLAQTAETVEEMGARIAQAIAALKRDESPSCPLPTGYNRGKREGVKKHNDEERAKETPMDRWKRG